MAFCEVMYKEGLNDGNWSIVKNLNKDLTAKVSTKNGHTRKIAIKDSIKQGGVLSVLYYGLLMDESLKK